MILAPWWFKQRINIARGSFINCRDCGFPFMPSLRLALRVLFTGKGYR